MSLLRKFDQVASKNAKKPNSKIPGSGWSEGDESARWCWQSG